MNLWQKLQVRKKLTNVFKSAHLYLGTPEHPIFPKIQSLATEDYSVTITFSIPNGLDPKILEKNFYVFEQYFGKQVELTGEIKTFHLTIYTNTRCKAFTYDYSEILKVIEQNKILFPIVAGRDLTGTLHVYDATNHPNLLIFGEPGSGKSTILHSILATSIQYFEPSQLKLILADFKQSELSMYEEVSHVESVSYEENTFAPCLSRLKGELKKRGHLLKQYKVRHINKLPQNAKPPYIVLCVDEFVMIKDKNVMAELLQIASLGRAYGIYCILSMQRPSHSIISTDVRAVLSVRMGFRTVDRRNALIGETPGSEKISKNTPGKFLFSMDELKELQAPYLSEDDLEKILDSYTSTIPKTPHTPHSKVIDLHEVEENIFGVLDDDK